MVPACELPTVVPACELRCRCAALPAFVGDGVRASPSATTAVGGPASFAPECAPALDFGLRPGSRAERLVPSVTGREAGRGCSAGHGCGCRGRGWPFLCPPAPRRARTGRGPRWALRKHAPVLKRGT